MSEKQRVLRAVADGPQHEAEGEVARQPTGIRVDTATESPHSGREPAQSDIQPAGRAAGQAQGVRGSGETSRASFAPREGGLVLHGAVRCGDASHHARARWVPRDVPLAGCSWRRGWLQWKWVALQAGVQRQPSTRASL